jgi:hypothetical protein
MIEYLNFNNRLPENHSFYKKNFPLDCYITKSYITI